MPTYQYTCTECGNELEAVQKFTDDALTECPACPGRLRKVFSAVGVVFKGSGFYRTDSREKTSAAGAPSSKSSSAEKSSGEKSSEKSSGDSGSSGKKSSSGDSGSSGRSEGASKSGSKPKSESGSSGRKSSESAA